MSLASDIDAATSAPPRVLILDDEFAQRTSVRLQLRSAGTFEFIEFEDPRPALDFLRSQTVDVVIVDIRMPSLPVDGLWFMENFREFDRVTSMIIRTADDDTAIADAGLTARAIRRVIKAQPNADDTLRRSTLLAIEESRERRRTQQDAAVAASTRDTLVSVLARTDDHMTAAEMCRGFAVGLINPITALAGYADLLTQEDLEPSVLQDIARKNRAIVERLQRHILTFTGNPFVDAMVNPLTSASVNGCIAALEPVMARHYLVTERDLSFSTRSCSPDVIFSANPNRTLTALRHLAEFCALHATERSALSITGSIEQNPRAAIDQTKNRHFVLNARWTPRKPCVVFTVRATVPLVTRESLQSALRTCSENPRIANLLMVSATVIDDHLVFEATLSDKAPSSFSLYVPSAG